MSLVWVAMLALSLVFGLLTGRGAALGGAAMEGAGKAITLGISLAGSLCLWSGFAALLKKSGLQRVLTRLLSPLLGRLYPTARRDAETMDALCGNVTANLLGLGSAATPLGVAAPFDILPAVWLSSLLSVSTGILAAKGLGRLWR